MTIDTAQLQEFLIFAQKLADAAGDVQRRYFRTPVAVESKHDASPVSVADRETEAMMRRVIRSQYPTHGIFGEEEARENTESEWQWVLDPIDGTRSFLAGYPLFTTLVALTHQGVPQLGVIDQPILRERWKAARGSKTFFNNKLVTVAECIALKNAHIATTSMRYFTDVQRNAFKALREKANATVIGGDGYAYAMLAIGQLHAVLDAGMKPYDFLALVPVVECAGGMITDWQGKALTLESDGTVLAASTPSLHAEIMKILRGAA